MLVTFRALAPTLVVLAALAPRSIAAAETVPARPAVVAAATADAADPVVRVDESALRYYAAQHATARVDAEIRRLRTLYPGWEPPADLYDPGANDDQALWDLFGKGRLDEMKLEIDRRAARRPGWHPSAEMVEKLRRAEKRGELVAAATASDWAGVLRLADDEPTLVDVADLDVLWRVAEAAHRTGADDRALGLYRLALSGPATAEERRGTVRKAIAVVGPTAAGALFAEERRGADGKGEFDDLRLDLSRAALGEWLRPDRTDPVPEADRARLAAAAKAADAAAGDAALAGWVERKRHDDAAAADWFARALAHGGDARATLGAALTAESRGRRDEAIRLASTRTEDAEVGALYLRLVAADLTRPKPAPLAAETLARYAATTERLESGDAAQALAWYAYATRRFEPARAWFARAMTWQPSAKTAEGHLLAVRALGDRAALEHLAADYRGRFPELPPIEKAAEPDRRVAAAAAKPSCPALLAEGARTMPSDPGRSLALGWCLMERNRAEEAARAFAAADRGDGRVRAEAAYGRSLAHLRSGRTEDAARVAADGALSVDRRDEIGRIVLAQQAIAAFDRENWPTVLDVLDRRRAHAAEPRDLMTMRAWALHHLGRDGEAHGVFTLLDRQLSTAETRSGLAATDLEAQRLARRS